MCDQADDRDRKKTDILFFFIFGFTWSTDLLRHHNNLQSLIDRLSDFTIE